MEILGNQLPNQIVIWKLVKYIQASVTEPNVYIYKFIIIQVKNNSCYSRHSRQSKRLSESVGSILASDSCEKSQRSAESRGFSPGASIGFLQQRKLSGWVMIIIAIGK
jgi:hypothetical protein